MSFFQTDVFQWILLPLLIFCARIIDVSIGTVRIMFVAKGIRKLATVFAFFEVLIWIITVKQVLSNMSNPLQYVGYAGGFAAGTYIGMVIEHKISIGYAMIRVITARDGRDLAAYLRSHGWRVTDLDAEGNDGPVRIIFLVLKRKDLERVTNIIKEFNPNAFYSIEDVRFVSGKTTPLTSPMMSSVFRRGRKGK